MATDIPSIKSIAFVPPSEGVRAFAASPPRAASAVAPAPAAEAPIDLEAALDDLATRAAEAGAQLDFRIDKDSGRVIVSIVDRSDGTVLRQMPSEEALRIARSLARYEPHLIELRA